jgi:hypothetical protein
MVLEGKQMKHLGHTLKEIEAFMLYALGKRCVPGID